MSSYETEGKLIEICFTYKLSTDNSLNILNIHMFMWLKRHTHIYSNTQQCDICYDV